jgi:S-adenosylmethionine-diacylgycerolhomoserine-N-methlytransferase
MTAHDQAMDRMYRHQRHFYDATRRYYLVGRDRLINDLGVPPGGSVLEIGCGTGRNLVKVAEKYPSAWVFGIDISTEMLKSASRAVARAEGAGRIRLARGDAVSFEPEAAFGVTRFDRIFFSYTLSMIPDWQGALRRAQQFLAQGGQLHVADFGQCEDLPGFVRPLLFAWLRRFQVTPRAELKQAFRHCAEQAETDWQFSRDGRGYSWHLTLGAARPR